MSYPQIIRGSAAWLYSVVVAQAAVINAELTDAVDSTTPAPQFVTFMGDPVIPSGPTLAICYASTRRSRFAQHNYQFDLTFRILALIPHSGDDTPENFEMARQVAADNLQSLFTDESLTLNPAINAGPLGTVNALSTDFSTLVDIFPRKLPDGITVVRGFEIPVTVSFTLTASA